ncbi:hypothetical protein AYI68_g3 [Smittium mucronatum]|uniref:Uncharacterized protein n=1 Tax=Smittium mucronatum TaxID=133383 RepID=A0A1R0H9L8_9FUNG|nr:hypothetical protein AYI68_g3 [Smittium mucronatum]
MKFFNPLVAVFQVLLLHLVAARIPICNEGSFCDRIQHNKYSKVKSMEMVKRSIHIERSDISEKPLEYFRDSESISPFTSKDLKYINDLTDLECSSKNCNMTFYFGLKDGFAVQAQLQCFGCPDKKSNIRCMRSLSATLYSGIMFYNGKVGICNSLGFVKKIKSILGYLDRIKIHNAAKYNTTLE